MRWMKCRDDPGSIVGSSMNSSMEVLDPDSCVPLESKDGSERGATQRNNDFMRFIQGLREILRTVVDRGEFPRSTFEPVLGRTARKDIVYPHIVPFEGGAPEDPAEEPACSADEGDAFDGLMISGRFSYEEERRSRGTGRGDEAEPGLVEITIFAAARFLELR
jgi:hypothetical protein